jgi:Uncharacterised nucleotidyltransferase
MKSSVSKERGNSSMSRKLARAVIDTFRDSHAAVHSMRLAGFRYDSWTAIYEWLDASGLALYFLARVRRLGIESAVPIVVIRRLELNATDNGQKTAHMFKEFMAINREFTNAGLSYANLKGFTLTPEACEDIALRSQLDLDFLVSTRDVQQCQMILSESDYSLTGRGENVLEFKAGTISVPVVRDLYKLKPQRSVEVHFAPGNETDEATGAGIFDRLRSRSWDGLSLPILSDLDTFIGHASHLFKHLKGEWTRASWILEYVNFINYHRENDVFWLQVHNFLNGHPDSKLSVGIATLVADRSFGLPFIPKPLAIATIELSSPIKLWVELYTDDILLAKFPGTKLYLLLLRAISAESGKLSVESIRKLFPLRRPAKIIAASEARSWKSRLKGYWAEVSYCGFRLRFHLKHGLLLLIEEPRWRRSIAAL